MNKTLNKEKRDEILQSLSSEQRDFIQNYMKRGKKTVFANVMAKDKGIIVPDGAANEEIEMLLDEWVLHDYIDSGFTNPDTPCECGRPLRYQYIVQHQSTGIIKRFGLTHFQEHTSISPKLVKEIINGFEKIDYERDDILNKIKMNWTFEKEIPHIPNEFVLPNDISQHLQVDVPLLDRQIKRLKKEIEEFLDKRDFEKRQINMQREIIATKKVRKETVQANYDLFNIPYLNIKKNIGLEGPYNRNTAILHYLQSGISSARMICELLIKNHNEDDKRYLTGKPKIYVSVCLELDELVIEGFAELIGIEGKEDRRYKIV